MVTPLLIARHEDTDLALLPALANRHGLITGATGTGRTITLQLLAERFSAIGVPVFMADVKGDLSGLAAPGSLTPKLQARLAALGGSDYAPAKCPVTFWDVFGAQGHPVRATISDMGPVLLSRLLNVNDTQAGVLQLVFRIADDNGLLLLDLKDLRAMIQYVGENAKSFTTEYGNVSAASIGAIQRGLLNLGEQGGEIFFGEPMLDIADLMPGRAAVGQRRQWRGRAHGGHNIRKHLQTERETVGYILENLDIIGSEYSFPHYPMGWAQVSNTPLKWYKKNTHGGGIRAPLIVHWPHRIRQTGGVRHQYHHVSDVVPTVLDLVGVGAPEVYKGTPQMPLHGISMAYTFDQAEAPTRKETQHFELVGDRALWHRGWKIVARHEKGADFHQDRWELYHLDRDFSETRDLAAQQPERVQAMVSLWWDEARRYGVLPLDDRES